MQCPFESTSPLSSSILPCVTMVTVELGLMWNEYTVWMHTKPHRAQSLTHTHSHKHTQSCVCSYVVMRPFCSVPEDQSSLWAGEHTDDCPLITWLHPLHSRRFQIQTQTRRWDEGAAASKQSEHKPFGLVLTAMMFKWAEIFWFSLDSDMSETGLW